MKPIVYIHSAAIGKYQAVVNELMGGIITSGLYESCEKVVLMNCGIGNLDRWWLQLGLKTKYVELESGLDDHEKHTIEILRQDAIKNPDTCYLYVHTKGVSVNSDNSNIDQWRRMMSYFMIYGWRSCLESLSYADTVGVDFRTEPVRHYSGNFWWAKGSYIATLPEVTSIPLIFSERHKAEFWLCSNEKGLHHCLYDSTVDCHQRHLYSYPIENYKERLMIS